MLNPRSFQRGIRYALCLGDQNREYMRTRRIQFAMDYPFNDNNGVHPRFIIPICEISTQPRQIPLDLANAAYGCEEHSDLTDTGIQLVRGSAD